MTFTQTTRRERILVYGSYKLGKSTCWLDIADTYHKTGNMKRSITLNAERFDMPPFLVQLLKNTLPRINRMAAASSAEASYPHVEEPQA